MNTETGPYSSLTVLIESEAVKEDLQSIANKLAEEHNAKHVGFVDHAELEGYGYTLGYWTQDAGHLKEKDWSTRPNQEEVNTYVAWRTTMYDLRKDAKGGHLYAVVDDDEGIQVTASKLLKDRVYTERAIEKVTYWLVEG